MNRLQSKWCIVRYSRERQEEWNEGVVRSRNATFLFQREYMDYHADRFSDHSLMCYHSGKLQALLPAHDTEEKWYCSHNGLTYGGFLITGKMTAVLMLELFEEVIRYLKNEVHAVKWIYRPIPHIYAVYPSEEDLYALFRHHARLTERKIATVLPQAEAWAFSELRRRKVKQAVRHGLELHTDTCFEEFWEVLVRNLQERHETCPVHTLKEIQRLAHSFPEQIILHRVTDKAQDTLAGCVMYITSQVAHVQYIASTAEGRAKGAVDFLFDQLIHDVYAGKKYFDLGTSVEDGGQTLNEGLIFQKEGFGGRAVMYDTYEVDIENDGQLS